jgi:hypothetical protein
MLVVFAALAVVASGLLAGLGLDRTIVALPAWRRVGVTYWAAFSRQADLGNGLVLYSLLGIGAPLLSIAAAVGIWLDPSASMALAPATIAALLAIAHVISTARAAPEMARLRHLGDDDQARLHDAFVRFERWQAIRATLQALTFAVSVWALVALTSAG